VSASLRDAWDALHVVLTGTPRLSLAKTIVQGEPRPGELPKPISVTSTPAGMDAREHRFQVRVYCSADNDVIAAQRDWVTTIDEVENLLAGANAFNAATWTTAYLPDINALVATANGVSSPRSGFGAGDT